MTKIYFFILWKKAGTFHRNEVTEIIKNIIKRHHEQCEKKGHNPTYKGADWEAMIMNTGLGKYFNYLQNKERIAFVSRVIHSILKSKKDIQKTSQTIIVPQQRTEKQLRLSF